MLSDAVEGVVGYTLLIAMTLTSFKFGRSLLTPGQWKLLHKSGIYWIWYYAWSVYWFNLFYYESPALFIDYIYYWGGLLAWGLRLAAWTKKRSATDGKRTVVYLLSGTVAVVIGLIGSSYGRAWSPQTYEFMYGFRVIEFVEPFMPYSPLVPFYPLFILMFGAFLIVRSRG